jgi:hypothetical protein
MTENKTSEVPTDAELECLRRIEKVYIRERAKQAQLLKQCETMAATVQEVLTGLGGLGDKPEDWEGVDEWNLREALADRFATLKQALSQWEAFKKEGM